ncbi:MAG: epoxyqueuosine reductase [Deltaproteobacteria bacterium]|nr:epoxyqueuosine reductase [Deltaproteobacteria bacterium]
MVSKIQIDTVRDSIEGFVSRYSSCAGTRNWWRKPILVTATVDKRFAALPHIAAKNHLLPRELLAEARSVIVYFIPFIKSLGQENASGKFPCRNWAIAYVETNTLIEKVNAMLAEILKGAGYQATTTPPTANFDHESLMSRWSHKHLGHIAGLGRFGVHCQLITPSGCTGRLGSLVTDADLGNHPLCTETELCLHKQSETCLECVSRCPVDALAADGFDRQRCWQRLKVNQQRDAYAGLPTDTHVCGKCQVMIPCSFFESHADEPQRTKQG